MMTNTIKHSLKQMQPALGSVAYWSAEAFTLNNSDRTPEIILGSKEGDGYA